jgi:hypothetical protein
MGVIKVSSANIWGNPKGSRLAYVNDIPTSTPKPTATGGTEQTSGS